MAFVKIKFKNSSSRLSLCLFVANIAWQIEKSHTKSHSQIVTRKTRLFFLYVGCSSIGFSLVIIPKINQLLLLLDSFFRNHFFLFVITPSSKNITSNFLLRSLEFLLFFFLHCLSSSSHRTRDSS